MNPAKTALYLEYIAFMLRREGAPLPKDHMAKKNDDGLNPLSSPSTEAAPEATKPEARPRQITRKVIDTTNKIDKLLLSLESENERWIALRMICELHKMTSFSMTSAES